MATSFKRAAPRYKPQPRVLVLCEDSKSCRIYLQDAAKHYRCFAQVEIAFIGATDPYSIVQEAKKRQPNYEHVLCVVDRDSHAKFDDALRMAEHHPRVEVIVSYPCYEYWLLLHFTESRRLYMPSGRESAGDQVARELRSHDGMADYSKGMTAGLFATLLSRIGDARTRSLRVLKDAQASDTLNPSTRLHELLDLLEELGKGPQPL